MDDDDEYLIQMLLPLCDNMHAPIPAELHQQVQQELNDRFKGLTVYTRSPANGYWQGGGANVRRCDDMVMYEVMVRGLDAAWWSGYRKELEARFRQEEVMIRAMAMQRL